MKTRRNTGGFTLLELMLAVAIIGILSGVAAVNVVHYQRTLTQVELDGIAREIFVAAQNHLTMAESQGFMGVTDSDWGNQYEQSNEEKEENGTLDIHYYVVEHTPDRNSLNMLNLMLPFASVDETVLKGGSYVIRYQTDPALVLDVFYAVAESTPEDRDETINRKFAYTFTEEDENWIREYRGSDKKQARGDYESKHAIIGWYGVEPQQTPVSSGETLKPPIIKVFNAEQLYVEVTNQNFDANYWEKFQHARLHLEITGVKSGKKCPPIELIDNGYPVSNSYIRRPPDANFNDTSTFYVILDDVTQDGTRFHEIMADAGLLPGEDITICAVAYNNTELTNIATSASSTTNSLFASVNGSTADIANFRHLENLDSAVSHITSDNIHITQANQISDMNWSNFMSSGNVSVYYGNTHTQPGEYFPVTNGGKIKDDGTIEYDKQITYNGNGHTISNVKINVSGNAGLFTELGNRSTVKNLKLADFEVTSSGGHAGALAGVLDSSIVGGAGVPGVLAYGVDSAITGKTSVGGLVGEINGNCTIAQSAAAVYVTSSNGDAGGLIGSIGDASGTKVKVSDSYAGGHTENGKYNQGNCNVTATNGNAGGLIGGSAVTSTANLTVENCYATTSVDGKMAAGGLIGAVQGGTIKNCYVTGYVNNNSTAGAFAGEANNTNFANDDRYLSIVNVVNGVELHNVGNMENPNVSAFDTPHEYINYTPCTSDAVPYDKPTLPMYYGGKYLFKTISQLNKSGTYTAEWMTKHYGDWPMPEKQVINVKSGGA